MAVKLQNRGPTVVGAAAAVIVPYNGGRKRVWITQTTANVIRVGPQGVTAATGIRLGQNERVELIDVTDDIYAIREAAVDGSVCIVDLCE